MALKDRITQALAEAGITKADLAKKANLTHAAIGFLVNGSTKDIAGANLFPIADTLGVSARWLITGKPARPTDDPPQPLSSDPQVLLLAQRIALLNERKRSALMELLDLND